jgi:protein TonB
MVLEPRRLLVGAGALALLLMAPGACSRSESPPPPEAAPQPPPPPPPPPVVRDAAVDVVDAGGDAGDAGGARRGGKKPAAAAPTGGGGPGGVKVEGALPRAEADKAIRAVSAKLRACYDQERAKKPDLKGRVTFKLTINERGFVTVGEIVTSTLQGGSDAENCMVRAARDFRFPRGSGESTISFGTTFGR